MKPQYQIVKITVLILLMSSLSGCLDIFFKTEVHPNGQIDKIIVLEGDSTSILNNNYIPALNDSSWEKEWEALNDDKRRLSLTKSFKNFKEFNKVMNPDDSLPKIRLEAELKTKFRWFFTYIDYRETLLPSNPFTRLNWTEYLTEDEVQLISMDEEEREADPRYSEINWTETENQFEWYLYRSGYEELFHYFTLAVKKTSDSGITTDDLDNNKDVIFDSLFGHGNIEDTDDFLEHFYSVLDSSAVKKVVDNNPGYFDFFGKKIDFFNETLIDNYYLSIKMPGLLVDTNSEQIEGSSLSWEADFFNFYFNGLEMKAESRVINNWAFIVAGLVILGLLIVLLWNVFRKKRQENP